MPLKQRPGDVGRGDTVQNGKLMSERTGILWTLSNTKKKKEREKAGYASNILQASSVSSLATQRQSAPCADIVDIHGPVRALLSRSSSSLSYGGVRHQEQSLRGGKYVNHQ